MSKIIENSSNFKVDQEIEIDEIKSGEKIQGNFINSKIQKKKAKEIQCEICLKVYASKISIKIHMKNMHSNDSNLKIYHCDYCGMKFHKKFNLIKHLEVNHKSGISIIFECDFDGKIFKIRKKFLDHMQNHKRLEKCEICEKKLKNLKQHKREMHSKNYDKNFQCLHCDKKFKSKKRLDEHKRTHNKKFQCQICGQKFPYNSQLNEHMKYHDDAFRCKICFKNFTQKVSLKFHMKTHDENYSKPYKCELCEYSTDRKENLKRHLKIHDANPEKPFKCNQCDYKTDQKWSLKKHMQTHNPNRVKIPCLYCNHEVFNRQSLTAHIKKIHAQEIKSSFTTKS